MIWVWFLGAEEGEEDLSLAGLLVQGAQGILHTAFADPIEADFLPAPRRLGTLLPVSVADWGSDLLLEAPFDVGRWLVRRALAAHWEGRAARPPAGEYILYNDLLWQFAPPAVAPELTALLQEKAAGEETLDEEIGEGEIEEAVAALLRERCFHEWALPVRPFAETLLHSFGEGGAVTLESMARHILRQMEGGAPEVRDWLRDSLREGLRAQAIWLYVAGKPELARWAARLAQLTTARPPSQNPLLHALLLRGLQRE